MEASLKESRLLLAIQAIRKDPHLSIRAAAKIYNISRTTLSERLGGRFSRRDIPANSRKLTDLEENTITKRNYLLLRTLNTFTMVITLVRGYGPSGLQ